MGTIQRGLFTERLFISSAVDCVAVKDNFHSYLNFLAVD